MPVRRHPPVAVDGGSSDRGPRTIDAVSRRDRGQHRLRRSQGARVDQAPRPETPPSDAPGHSPREQSERASLAARALLPIRFFFGATFVYAGIDKLIDPAFFDAANPASIVAQLAAFTTAPRPPARRSMTRPRDGAAARGDRPGARDQPRRPGLVYDVAVSDGIACITLTVTSPAYPARGYLEDQVRRAVLKLPGILGVTASRWSSRPCCSPARERLRRGGPSAGPDDARPKRRRRQVIPRRRHLVPRRLRAWRLRGPRSSPG